MDASTVIDRLALAPLEGEGGWFRRLHADGASAAIVYLLAPGERSALHRLDVTEVWHRYDGGAAALLLLHPDGTASEPVVGVDLAAGQCPQVVVPAGTWMGAEPVGGAVLLGCTTAPPFRWEGFELGDADALARGWPQSAARIARLAPG